MAMGFFANGARKRLDQILAVDLGSRTTKAVHIQRWGEDYTLSRYALLDAPIFEKSMSVEMLAEHLKAVNQALQAKTKVVSLTAGVNDALVRHVEMPRMPAEDMRLTLKLNSRNFLQQDLNNYVLVERGGAETGRPYQHDDRYRHAGGAYRGEKTAPATPAARAGVGTKRPGSAWQGIAWPGLASPGEAWIEYGPVTARRGVARRGCAELGEV